jgi:hypothetical protein
LSQPAVSVSSEPFRLGQKGDDGMSWFIEDYKLKDSEVGEILHRTPMGIDIDVKSCVETTKARMQDHMRQKPPNGVHGVRLVDPVGNQYFKWDFFDQQNQNQADALKEHRERMAREAAERKPE